MQVWNQWKNTTLIMLNNKGSVDNGSCFCYSFANKTEVIRISCVGDCYCYRHEIFQNILSIFNINIISQSNNDNSQQGPRHQACLRAHSSSVAPLHERLVTISYFCKGTFYETRNYTADLQNNWRA
jgi:hypothetical protein